MVTRKKAAKKKARLRTKEDVHAAKAETLLVLLGAQLTDVSTLLFGLSAQLADRDDAKIQRTVADAALNRVEQQEVVSKAALKILYSLRALESKIEERSEAEATAAAEKFERDEELLQKAIAKDEEASRLLRENLKLHIGEDDV